MTLPQAARGDGGRVMATLYLKFSDCAAYIQWSRMRAPETKVVRDRKGWGVKVKWPRSGPWTRHMLFPRFAWHGPFGNRRARWPDREGAEIFKQVLDDTIRNWSRKPFEGAVVYQMKEKCDGE